VPTPELPDIPRKDVDTMHPTQKQADVGVTDWTPADILRAAARYIERYGWTQRVFHRPVTGQAMPAACVAGAICMVLNGQPVMPAGPDADWALNIFEDYLFTEGRLGDNGCVDSWNDEPGRTANHVVAMLHAAADNYDGACIAPVGGAA
jgi:hypothetical protein